MIWLTWRQHRKQALYTLHRARRPGRGHAAHRPGDAPRLHQLRPGGLRGQTQHRATITSGNTPDCDALSQQFQNQYRSVSFIAILFVILPAIVGMFFGAPLIAREVEPAPTASSGPRASAAGTGRW